MPLRQSSPLFEPAKSTVRDGKTHEAPSGAKNVKAFRVYRWNPDDPASHRIDTFEIDIDDCGLTVLDALIKIKDEVDSTLTFRRSCREGVCGSCAMNIDGANTLACTKPIDEVSDGVRVFPLPALDVIKDLVPDLDRFYAQYAQVGPWQRSETLDRRERHQSPDQRAGLDGLWECILCACCTTACPAYWWDGESYLGPAVLLQVRRWLADSRDERPGEHLGALEENRNRLFSCRGIGNCTLACPRNLDPAKAIAELKKVVFVRA